jgi:hypothetical protein
MKISVRRIRTTGSTLLFLSSLVMVVAATLLFTHTLPSPTLPGPPLASSACPDATLTKVDSIALGSTTSTYTGIAIYGCTSNGTGGVTTAVHTTGAGTVNPVFTGIPAGVSLYLIPAAQGVSLPSSCTGTGSILLTSGSPLSIPVDDWVYCESLSDAAGLVAINVQWNQ